MEADIFKQNYYVFNKEGVCLGRYWVVNFGSTPENQIMNLIQAGWCQAMPINACTREDESQPILCTFALHKDYEEDDVFDPTLPLFGIGIMSRDKTQVKKAVIAKVSQWWGMDETTAETLAEELLEKPQEDNVIQQVAINKLVGYEIVRPRGSQF